MENFKITIENKNDKLSLTFSEGLPRGTAKEILKTLQDLNLYTPIEEINTIKFNYDANH